MNRKVHCIHRKVHFIQWSRLDWAILMGLTLLAALLRFYKLGVIPPGFQFDEAYNALDAAGVLEGQRPLFLPLNGGREATPHAGMPPRRRIDLGRIQLPVQEPFPQ